ncbi:Uncharacterised protein [Achromobacter dolens]|nr:Uncharacterised protein [Achromobacter dolens]
MGGRACDCGPEPSLRTSPCSTSSAFGSLRFPPGASDGAPTHAPPAPGYRFRGMGRCWTAAACERFAGPARIGCAGSRSWHTRRGASGLGSLRAGEGARARGGACREERRVALPHSVDEGCERDHMWACCRLVTQVPQSRGSPFAGSHCGASRELSKAFRQHGRPAARPPEGGPAPSGGSKRARRARRGGRPAARPPEGGAAPSGGLQAREACAAWGPPRRPAARRRGSPLGGAASARGVRGVGAAPPPGRPKAGQPPRGAASAKRAAWGP